MLLTSNKLGEITFDSHISNKDEIIMFAIENKAVDIIEEENTFRVISEPDNFGILRNSIEQRFLEPKTSKLIWTAVNLIEVNKDEAKKIFYIIDSLEENDDIQNVFTNINVSENVIKELKMNKIFHLK